MLLASCMQHSDINPGPGDPKKPQCSRPAPAPRPKPGLEHPPEPQAHSAPRMLSRRSTPVPSQVGSPAGLLNYDSRKPRFCDGSLTLRRQQRWRLPEVGLKVRGVSKSVRSRPGSPGPRRCARYLGFGAFGTIWNGGNGGLWQRGLALLPLYLLSPPQCHLSGRQGFSLWDARQLLASPAPWKRWQVRLLRFSPGSPASVLLSVLPSSLVLPGRVWRQGPRC